MAGEESQERGRSVEDSRQSGGAWRKFKRALAGPVSPPIVVPDDPRYAVVRRALIRERVTFSSRNPIYAHQVERFVHNVTLAVLAALDGGESGRGDDA